MTKAFILFPNCLFKEIAGLSTFDKVYLVEEWLFFRLYRFHKQKLLFHRASMKAYEHYLQQNNIPVEYISTADDISDVRLLMPHLHGKGVSTVTIFDPIDNWLEKRIKNACTLQGIRLQVINNPLFINTAEELAHYQDDKKKYFQTDFYIYQRISRQILVDKQGQPLHGKWSFDAENRLKYPKEKLPPPVKKYSTHYHDEAKQYVETHFNDNYGEIDDAFYYPSNHDEAKDALDDFFKTRFAEFGIYEDAIVREAPHLNHSLLSPLINTGLLLPGEVVDAAIDYAARHNVPYNSLEGFARQIIGWREFIRMVYTHVGSRQRTKHYWLFTRKIPRSFYDGTTGIAPVDATIKKLKRSAYNHHIERLMILSNFMLLCEFDPDEVYRWFMEMYIDAYDWVMVPNVYGMGQFADGGVMSTKPYISGSNYIFKMSDYKKGEPWAKIWDALFWRFMHVHRSFFQQNPRLGMLLNTFDKWDEAKRNDVLTIAENYLKSLDG